MLHEGQTATRVVLERVNGETSCESAVEFRRLSTRLCKAGDASGLDIPVGSQSLLG